MRKLAAVCFSLGCLAAAPALAQEAAGGAATPRTEPASPAQTPAAAPAPAATPAPAPARTSPAPRPAPRPTTTGDDHPPTGSAWQDDEEEDEGDPYDFLWIEGMAGWSFVDLRGISTNNFYPEVVRLRGDGPMGGGAVGFRIEFLSVGARAAIAHYGDDFQVGTATAEVTLALPLPIIKPYIRLGFGLGWHGDSNYMAPEMSQTTVFGWAFTGAVGADIYFIDWFAVGAAVTADILNMSRQSIDDPMPGPGDVVFEDPGDAVGAQVRGHIAVSFHL